MFLPTLENWPEKKNIQVLENYETLIQENCTKVSFVQFKRELARYS